MIGGLACCSLALFQAFAVPSAGLIAVLGLVGVVDVLLGKLMLTEGAWVRNHPRFPTPVNPWDAGRWTGASSNGSAANVTSLSAS